MTHRERVLRTFRFEDTDRAPYDLMEGVVWPELADHFRAAHGLEDPGSVLDFLDTDFRWTFMERVPDANRPAAPRSTDADDIHSWEVARGPLADAKTVAEVDAHTWSDHDEWRVPDLAEFRRRFPDHALVFSASWTPLFWGVCDAFGVEAALLNLTDAPALFEAAVRNIHERYMERLTRGVHAAQGICDICWLGDDFASQEAMLLSPAQWRKHIKPYLAEQVQLARSHGLYVLYHSCGAIREVLPDLIEIGVNGHLVFQTRARGMDAESIAREFGGRMAFYGGVDIQHLLPFGTPEEVAAEVRANVRAFADCGGHVVANSHHCVPAIRGENVEAMCRAARGTSA